MAVMARSGWRAAAAAAVVLGSVALTAGASGVPPDTGAAEVGSFAHRVAPPSPPSATLGFVGDIHTLRAVNYSAARPDGTYDYRPMFTEVAPLLSWFDLAVCAIEAPVAPPGTPVIVAPPRLSSAASLIDALAGAGFDRCATAGNHITDRGMEGIDATLAAFDRTGMTQAGTARSAAEAAPQAQILELGGIRVAHLSYSWAIGGQSVPSSQPWRANTLDPGRVIADAAAARQAGADAVAVSLTWGFDRIVTPTAYQRSVADQLTRSGMVDLIVGQQAHVLQPIEQVNGVWVVYGMGNFLSDLRGGSSWPAGVQDAMIVGFTLTVGDDGEIEVSRPSVIPTWIDRLNGHVIRPTFQAADPTLSESVRWQLEASRRRTGALLGEFIPIGL